MLTVDCQEIGRKKEKELRRGLGLSLTRALAAGYGQEIIRVENDMYIQSSSQTSCSPTAYISVSPTQIEMFIVQTEHQI